MVYGRDSRAQEIRLIVLSIPGIMKRYLIALFCFVALLSCSCYAWWHDNSVWVTDRYDWVPEYLFLCVPFAVFAGIAMLIGYTLRRKGNDGKIIFPRSILNIQIVLSVLYMGLISYRHLIPSRYWQDTKTVSENCTSDNLHLLSTADTSLEQKYLMAYDSLKHIINSRVKIKTDTAICLEGVFSKPFDTTVNGHKMTTKIIFTVTLPSKKNIVFKYLFCCNDCIGFTVNRYPLAQL